jgi:tungstate transport system substrate-binding protein
MTGLGLITVVLMVMVVAGCGDETDDDGGSAGTASGEMILATTTSTVDSGLLDTLLPAYEKTSDCSVKALGVGSGEALELGSQGNADVLLSHSPDAEEEFMAIGDGSRRDAVMHNDFVLVGPPDDPADVAGSAEAADAMARIAANGSTFVSRADESGTNTRELDLWAEAGVTPGGDWYQETGQGMGETLTITSQLQGYTLSDRATYLSTDGLNLDVLTEGSKDLLNFYHVIVVDHPGTNLACAEEFADWLLSLPTQQLIGDFGLKEFGRPLFVPDAKP